MMVRRAMQPQCDVAQPMLRAIQRWLLRAGAAGFVFGLFAATAHAVLVGSIPGIVPDTSVNPVSFPGWTQGDPGFNNFSLGSGYVYLGDGWVLSARHVGYNATGGV